MRKKIYEIIEVAKDSCTLSRLYVYLMLFIPAARKNKYFLSQHERTFLIPFTFCVDIGSSTKPFVDLTEI